MYTTINFKTKKAFKEYVASGKPVGVYSPGPYPANQNGREVIEGPHYPAPHSWYAQVEVKEGVVIKVK